MIFFLLTLCAIYFFILFIRIQWNTYSFCKDIFEKFHHDNWMFEIESHNISGLFWCNVHFLIIIQLIHRYFSNIVVPVWHWTEVNGTPNEFITFVYSSFRVERSSSSTSFGCSVPSGSSNFWAKVMELGRFCGHSWNLFRWFLQDFIIVGFLFSLSVVFGSYLLFVLGSYNALKIT